MFQTLSMNGCHPALDAGSREAVDSYNSYFLARYLMQNAQQNPQKDFKKKKITLAIGYVVSFALLGIVALDFMGVDIPVTLTAHAQTVIGSLRGNDGVGGGFHSFNCETGSYRQYQGTYSAATAFNAFWFACEQ